MVVVVVVVGWMIAVTMLVQLVAWCWCSGVVMVVVLTPLATIN